MRCRQVATGRPARTEQSHRPHCRLYPGFAARRAASNGSWRPSTSLLLLCERGRRSEVGVGSLVAAYVLKRAVVHGRVRCVAATHRTHPEFGLGVARFTRLRRAAARSIQTESTSRSRAKRGLPEPDALKGACPVLRRAGRREAPGLSDQSERAASGAPTSPFVGGCRRKGGLSGGFN